VYGILAAIISFFQVLERRVRNSWLNGPQYDRNPVLRSTSPTRRYREETHIIDHPLDAKWRAEISK